MEERKRRTYQSPARAAQAAATRRAILDSAHRLFAARGYAATTMSAIAVEAGVAVQTVYAVFVRKRNILFGLLDRMPLEADLTGFQARLAAASGDPRSQLREVVGFSARMYGGSNDVTELARTIGGADQDLADLWREGERRRYAAESELVADWHVRGLLRAELSASVATDILWALSGPDTFRLLVRERAWATDHYRNWLATALERELLADPAHD
ncbi:MAG TPA: helix-turn-helix domain-containing protein [Nocardioides sp.]|uniref:TetR/AcrR family transcriptional regulator n=1 Tax=Nocardioides sp. TaxID=35761 RepID=UPI002F3F7374